jgi:CheY-like chemotaxis protein
MVGDRERVLKAGFQGYIAKPIEPTTFAAQIKTFFVQSSPRLPDGI